MRIAVDEHTARPWRIHEIAHDFELEDVWALPAVGNREEFPLLLSAFEESRPTDEASLPIRFVWAVRWKLGEWLGWDDPGPERSTQVPTISDRVPDELRDHRIGSDRSDALLTPLYRTENEFAAEVANRTVHAVMHLSWVPDVDGDYRGQMAVLVKPSGRLGRAYMVLIKPFRFLLIYPALMRSYERGWQKVTGRNTVTAWVGTEQAPESARFLTSVREPDYTDVFTLTTDVEATAEQWARAMLGDTPSTTELVIWRGLLGLRVTTQEASPDTVAGWRLAARGDDWIRLEAGSRSLTCELVVRAADGTVSLGTFIRYDRPLRGLVWKRLSAVHRRLAPGLLRGAAARLARR